MINILPFCAKWQRASSTWRRVEAELVLELAINHVSAPSSISSERPILCPAKERPSASLKVKMTCVILYATYKRTTDINLELLLGIHILQS